MTDKKNLYQRILAVTSEVGAFSKDGRNAFHNYQYASIEAVIAIIQPILVKHGVVLTYEVVSCVQVPVRQFTQAKGWTENEVTQACVLMRVINADNPEETYSVKTYGFGIDSQDKGVFKAISGARKYGIFGMFNLMAGDDDPEYSGGNGGSKSKPAPRQTTAPQPQMRTQAPDPKLGDKAQKLRAILMPDYTGDWPPLGDEKNGKRWPINIATAKTFSQPATEKQVGMVHKIVADLGYNADDDQRHDLLKAMYVMYEVPDNQRIISMASPAFTKGHASWFIDASGLIKRKDVGDPVPWPKAPKTADEDHIDLTPDADCDLDADIDSGQLDKEPYDG